MDVFRSQEIRTGGARFVVFEVLAWLMLLTSLRTKVWTRSLMSVMIHIHDTCTPLSISRCFHMLEIQMFTCSSSWSVFATQQPEMPSVVFL
jgi:hypothetical protein